MLKCLKNLTMKIRQSEIWQVYFDPFVGSEQAGNRPAIVVSGNTMNKYFNVLLVCPLTSSLKNYKGHPIIKPSPENGLQATSEALVFHIRSISKKRFKKKIGQINQNELDKIKNTLNKLLDY